MKLRQINQMLYDMIDVHIGGIQVTNAIFVNFVDNLHDDEIAHCVISEPFTQASLVFNVFELDEATEEEQIDIVCHEMAHLICEEPLQDEEEVICDGHDDMWKQAVSALGGIPNYY